MPSKITEHPATAKAAEALRLRLLEAQRKSFAPLGPYALEAMIRDLRRRVEALERKE
jgi:hypothetical protein